MGETLVNLRKNWWQLACMCCFWVFGGKCLTNEETWSRLSLVEFWPIRKHGSEWPVDLWYPWWLVIVWLASLLVTGGILIVSIWEFSLCANFSNANISAVVRFGAVLWVIFQGSFAWIIWICNNIWGILHFEYMNFWLVNVVVDTWWLNNFWTSDRRGVGPMSDYRLFWL